MDYYSGAAKYIYLLSQIPEEDWKFVDDITKDQLKQTPEILMKQLQIQTGVPQEPLPDHVDGLNLDYVRCAYHRYQNKKKKLCVGELGYLKQELEKKQEAYAEALDEYKTVMKSPDRKYLGQESYVPWRTNMERIKADLDKKEKEYFKVLSTINRKYDTDEAEEEKKPAEAEAEETEQELEKKKEAYEKALADYINKKDGPETKNPGGEGPPGLLEMNRLKKDLEKKEKEYFDIISVHKKQSEEKKPAEAEEEKTSSIDDEKGYVIYQTNFDEVLDLFDDEWKFVNEFFEIAFMDNQIYLKRLKKNTTEYASISIFGSRATIERGSGFLMVEFYDDKGDRVAVYDELGEKPDNVIDILAKYFTNLNPHSPCK